MIRYAFILVIIASLFSQVAIFYEMESLASALKMSWIIPAFFLILARGQKYLSQSLSSYYLLFFVTIGYIFLCDFVLENKYWGDDAMNIIISFLVFVVSYVFWTKNYSDKFLELLCLVLNISGIILGFIVWTKYLNGYDISARTYAFAEKNSMGQIILCTMIVPLCFINKNSGRITKNLLIFGCVWCVYVVALMKARATLVSLLFVVWYFYKYRANYRTKKWIRYGIILGIVYLSFNSGIWDTIKNNIFFGSRESSDLNDISSGRFDVIAYAISAFSRNIFFGIGNFYVDCFPVSLLVQFGIIGSFIIISYLCRFYRFVYMLDRKQNLFAATKLLLYTFLINGLFEAQPPFGPGIKCFTLWIMVGFSLAQSEKNKQSLANNCIVTK